MKLIAATGILLLATLLPGQEYGTDSRRAAKHFGEAVSLYRSGDLKGAEEALVSALRADGDFTEALRLLSQVYHDSGRPDLAIESYSRVLELDPEGDPEGYRLLAGMVLRTGDYRRAAGLAETYLSFPDERISHRMAAEKILNTCRFALDAMQHPVAFAPENLGDSVNSEWNEYWPAISLDEALLMFTVMVPAAGRAAGGRSVQEDFYYAERADSGWFSRKNAGPPLNTPDNEGAHTMTADGSMLIFTACNRRDGRGRCDLYMASKAGGGWSEPVNLGAPVNGPYSEKHPTVSADGRVLVFASDRPGGRGSYDLWVSRLENGSWSKPVNLGDSVNTAGVEQSPFLHPDQQTLYFSSDGWPGMGMGDLFMSRRTAEGNWSPPVNLGYPINTYNDEIGLAVDPGGSRAYFASDRGQGTDTDLYVFQLPDSSRPAPVSYLAGRIYDAGNMKGLAAEVRLIDLETGTVVTETGSHVPGGNYLASLPGNRNYALNVTAEGYLFHTAHFPFRGLHTRVDPLRMDVAMEPISEGKRAVMNNIFFETDSYALRKASTAELERVAKFLLSHPGLSVEIGGHTDSTGSASHNMALSEARAQAVTDFLVSLGVSPVRLVARGYGDTMPVAENTTEEGRALNRRTEMKILDVE